MRLPNEMQQHSLASRTLSPPKCTYLCIRSFIEPRSCTEALLTSNADLGLAPELECKRYPTYYSASAGGRPCLSG